MNKILVISLLNAYAIINDGCLTIVTDNKYLIIVVLVI